MADLDGELTVAQRLGRALDRGLLPAGGPAEAAERLIERLDQLSLEHKRRITLPLLRTALAETEALF